MSLQIGQILDNKYRIVRVLGQGGMGAVFEGENTRIHRRVAIKVLHASVATKADIVQRFEREAQAAGRIGSEHIVEVLDLGSLPAGERYMVMEFLDGEPLTDRIKARGKLTAGEAAPILRQLLTGLGAAHEAGIIHRDLKPDNVFLVRPKAAGRAAASQVAPSFVKLVDFGVSKFSATDSEFSMTRTGAVMGTPYYMSPEQARGQQIDHRSDLYSVGVVAYQMLTGRVPFNADTFNELLFKIALESPEPAELLAPGLDPHFAQIVMRGMARDPAHRFQSAAEFIYAIDQWAAQNPAALAWNRQTSGQLPQAQLPPGAAGAPHPFNVTPGGLGSASMATGPHRPIQVGTGAYPQLNVVTGPHQPVNVMTGAHAPLNFSQSQAPLTVTPVVPKRSGAAIAVVLAVVAVVGIGGGLAAFKLMGNKAAGNQAAAAPTNGRDEKAADTSATAKTEPTAAKSAEPTSPATSAPTAVATSTADASPAPTVAPKATGVAQAPPPVAPQQPKPPVTAPTPKPPPTTATGGRSITGNL